MDNRGKDSDPAIKINWGKSKSASKINHKSSQIDFDEQCEIWKLNHATTEHFPRKLLLCIRMPVMIGNNDATELCIAKGQEVFVVGWQSTKGPYDKCALDTLFVKLDNLSQTIQIPGTAHASQGKTRPYDVVHLNSCHSHMSCYTALLVGSEPLCCMAGYLSLYRIDLQIDIMFMKRYLDLLYIAVDT